MRLIDADAMIAFIDSGHHQDPNEKCFSESDLIGMIEERPTIKTCCGYPVEMLITFGELCNREGVTAESIKAFSENVDRAYEMGMEEFKRSFKAAVEEYIKERNDG